MEITGCVSTLNTNKALVTSRGNHWLGEYTEYKQGFGDIRGNHWLGEYLTDTDA